MKRLLGLTIKLTAIALLVWSCEGPMGPSGENGEDINETCKKCHNNEGGLSSKIAQASHSKHISGEAWLSEGTRNSCAPCHSSGGFLDVVKTGASNKSYIASASVLGNPAPIGCGTCHKLHTAYDSTDYALTFEGPSTLLIDTTKIVTVDLGNSSNLCIKCHQPRLIKQMDFAGAPTSTYTGITSYRFGPHYGTVGAIFAGKGGFEISGSMGYANSDHTADASCATCHMATQNGLSGGHTFYAKNEESGAINTNGCKTCHQSEITANTLTAKINTTQLEIKGYIDQLAAKINAIGANGDLLEKDSNGDFTGYIDVYDASSNTDGNYKNPGNGNHAIPVINNKQAAAIVNFQLIIREKSFGIHNYLYTKALLKNSIDAI